MSSRSEASSQLSSRILAAAASAALAFGLAALAPTSAQAAQNAPTSIRVGTSCSCKTCSTVVTVSMETYVKRCLPAEWIASWNVEALKAGAIAIRSYGGWHVYNPIASNFDICDTTCCQKYGTSQYANSDNATNATARVYLLDSNGRIARTEYCAEANDSANRDGCGNGYTINNPNDSVCLSDSACSGASQNGHGRGMCQWGTQRWAANHGKTYDWITDHYFAAYKYTRKTLPELSGSVNIIVDNANSGFTASSNWSSGTSASDKYGTSYRYRSTAAVTDNAQWTANIESAGTYSVFAWWSQGTNRSPTAPYVLPDGYSVKKNQQVNGGSWQLIGSLDLTTGNKTVKLSCWTATGYVVLADAVKFSK